MPLRISFSSDPYQRIDFRVGYEVGLLVLHHFDERLEVFLEGARGADVLLRVGGAVATWLARRTSGELALLEEAAKQRVQRVAEKKVYSKIFSKTVRYVE